MPNTRDVLGDLQTLGAIVDGTISEFVDDAVDSVLPYAFAYCSVLTTVSLPACVSVGSSAFHTCRSLTTVSLPVCTYAGEAAFISCSALTTITLPVCANMGGYAFANCKSLTSVGLPVCANMGSYAFQYCRSLISLYLTSVSSVPWLGNGAFTSTPIGGYSASAGQYGSVFVPASLYSAFLVATNWSSISERIVSVS